VNQIFRDDRCRQGLEALTQGSEQHASKRLSGDYCQAIKLPLASTSFEFRCNLPRKSFRLNPARSALAASCMVLDCAATAARGRWAIIDAAGPVGLEIAIVQPRSRVVQVTNKQHGRVATSKVVDACFRLIGNHDSNAHRRSP
jgi:hypothetical protein